MSSTTQRLSELSLRLRNLDPGVWEQFVQAFETRTMDVTVAVTAAEQNDVLCAQGRAREAMALLRIFKECGLSRGQPAP